MTESARLASYEPIPADGAGAEIFDKPALFYLTHQVVIDEWHGLRRTVSEAVNTWLDSTVRHELAATSADRGLLLSRVYGPQKHTHLLAHPEMMPLIGGRPILGTGVAWPSATVNPLSNEPYLCVRRSSSDAGRAAAAAFLDAGGRAFRSREGLKGRDEDVWPLYSWVPAKSKWWTDLDAYLEAITAGVGRLLDGLAAPLAAAVATGRSRIGDRTLGDRAEEESDTDEE